MSSNLNDIGDNILTSLSVSRECQIFDSGNVFVAELESNGNLGFICLKIIFKFHSSLGMEIYL